MPAAKRCVKAIGAVDVFIGAHEKKTTKTKTEQNCVVKGKWGYRVSCFWNMYQIVASLWGKDDWYSNANGNPPPPPLLLPLLLLFLLLLITLFIQR